MKKNFFYFFILISAKCFSQINVVPMPAEVTMRTGNFILNSKTIIFLAVGNLHNEATILNGYLQEKVGFKLPIVKGYIKSKLIEEPQSNCITLNYIRLENKLPGPHTLIVNKNKIYIAGDNNESIFYGMQTLLQLIEKKSDNFTLPQISIYDYPRFPYRGMHLDVCRHFFDVAYVKKYIDYLATYKYNTFHWHLTEDQGWRIEIKKYPNLTKVGAYRDRTLIGRYGTNTYDSIRYGGYYTQEEIKDVVKYATERYITVIPEIEMPGHSTAALASYPFLGCTKGPYKVMDTWGVLDDVYCAGNDSTFTFLQNVLDEVMTLFPSKYIHIGGDECPKERWKKCAACQKRMKDNNLKDEHALQSYFIQRMEKYLNGKGRSIIGWDEILEGGLAPNATVMSWRGEEGGIQAAKQNHDVIMTPGSHCYLDHSQSKNEDSLTIGSYLPLEKIYNYEPVPSILNAQQQTHILGAQGNVWTEYIANTSKLEYMIFPRMIALSEALWSPKAKRDWKDFERRLPIIFERLDKAKINYSKAYYDLKATILPTENFDGVYWKVDNNNKDVKIMVSPPGIFIPKNGWSREDSIEINKRVSKYGVNKFFYEKPIRITEFGTYLLTSLPNEINFEQKFCFNKATGKKITLLTPPSKPYEADGAFTLVNGVQNEKGMARTSEFIGFNGKDLEAIIDLGKDTEIKKVLLHTFQKKNSWIYHPKQGGISVMISNDGINFTTPEDEVTSIEPNTVGVSTITLSLSQKPINARFIKVIAKNFGSIPAGQPGEGKGSWLFVDEIEIF
jgi:hexosaminidase